MTQEVLKLALEALQKHAELGLLAGATITAIKEALAQPEQEPVASNCKHEWADDTKDKPAWRCIKCGENYKKANT